MWISQLQCLFTIIYLGSITISADRTPPTVIEPKAPKSMFIGQYDANVEVICKAKGYPKPRITWYRNGVRVGDFTERMQILPNGYLSLDRFNRRDNAYFQCKASNPMGTSVSQKIHIQADPLTTGITFGSGLTSSATVEINEGKYFAFRCDDMPEMPENVYRKRWFDRGKHQITQTERVGIDQTGTLHFAYTVTSDSDQYLCGLLKRRKGLEITLFPKGTLVVKSARVEDAKPKLVFSTSNIKALRSREVILQCFFSAKPEPYITWKTSSGDEIIKDHPRYKVDNFGRDLIINPVEDQDEISFECTGTNIVGSDKGTVKVNVTGPPISSPRGALKAIGVPMGKDAHLNCNASSAANEHIDMPRWYKNGKSLTKENLPSSRYKFYKDHTLLIIKDTRKDEDTANYQCNISNSEGYLFYDAYIQVIDHMVITKRPPKKIAIEFGDVVDISIKAKGDECCPINQEWLFVGEAIDDVSKFPPFQIGNGTDILFNSSRVPNDDLHFFLGRYTCRVSNLYVSVPVEFDIDYEASKTRSKIYETWHWLVWFLVAAIVLVTVTVYVVVKSVKLSTRRSRKTLDSLTPPTPEEKIPQEENNEAEQTQGDKVSLEADTSNEALNREPEIKGAARVLKWEEDQPNKSTVDSA